MLTKNTIKKIQLLKTNKGRKKEKEAQQSIQVAEATANVTEKQAKAESLRNQ